MGAYLRIFSYLFLDNVNGPTEGGKGGDKLDLVVLTVWLESVDCNEPGEDVLFIQS